MNEELTGILEQIRNAICSPKWEYRRVEIRIDDGSDVLNKYGTEGWELVAVYDVSRTQSHCIFKRLART